MVAFLIKLGGFGIGPAICLNLALGPYSHYATT